MMSRINFVFAAGALALAGCGSYGETSPTRGKTVFTTQAQQLEHHRQEMQRQEELAERVEPAIDLVVAGDYAGALRQFGELEGEGVEGLAHDKLLCLLHLGRGPDGLAMMRSLGPQEISLGLRNRLAPVLALVAHDETALHQFLIERVRFDRLTNATSHQQNQWARTAQVDERDVRTADLLMEIACEFGERYDDEMLHVVGEEAVRRGCTDQHLLSQYAKWLELNGNLREAVAKFRALQQSATDPEVRAYASRQIYDTNNIIHQFTRGRSIEEEEQRRHQLFRDKYFRQSW